MKRNEKERKTSKVDMYGRRKHKSFVESKHIFWKQGTDAKSLFSWMIEIRMDGFIEPMKEHNLETLGLFV